MWEIVRQEFEVTSCNDSGQNANHYTTGTTPPLVSWQYNLIYNLLSQNVAGIIEVRML